MPKLIVIKGPLTDKVFDLDNSNGTVFCGRNPRMNDISILDITISRKHLKIFKIGKNLFVEDLKSKHGTKINGKLIEPGEGFQVEEGDLITIGNTVMRLTEVKSRGPMVRRESIKKKIKKDSVSGGEPTQDLRSTKEIEFIYKVSELFKKQMNIHKFFEKVLKLLMDELPRIDNAGFFLFRDEKIETMKIIARSRDKSPATYSRKVLERVFMDRKTIRMSNTEFESADDYTDNGDSPKIGSVLCIPIISGNTILGTIYIDSIEHYAFRKEDQLLLNSLTGPIAVAIEKDWIVSNSGK